MAAVQVLPLQRRPLMPMWDDEPEYGAGACARCGEELARGRVYWIPRASGPDIRIVLHSVQSDCPAGAAPSAPPLRISTRL